MKRFRSYAKLRAIHTQKKQAIATRAHNQVLDHALLLVGISLRGYPASLQAFRCTSYQDTNHNASFQCADPRSEQHSVFQKLEEELFRYMNQCKKKALAPQIWIPNHSAFRHWEAICDRLSLTNSHPKLASILQYLTQRYHYGGTQTLLCTSQVLKRHWMTGQPDTQDESLESWIHWLEDKKPPKSPEHYSTFLSEEQEGNDPTRSDVVPILLHESQQRISYLKRTLSLFSQHAPSIISCWNDWWQQDLHYFSLFCSKPTSTEEDPLILAAQKLEERECTIENYIADIRREDSAYFYASLLEGHSMEGVIQTKEGQTISILCNQPIIRGREGDSLSLRKNQQAQFRVVKCIWTEEGYLVTLKKTFGRLSCSIHQKIQLTPGSMGWKFLPRQRRKISERMKLRGWIHRQDQS